MRHSTARTVMTTMTTAMPRLTLDPMILTAKARALTWMSSKTGSTTG